MTNPTGGIEVDHLQFDHCSAATGECASVPTGPTFASIACRIAALRAAVQAETQLGNIQGLLANALARAQERTEGGEAKCADGNTKAAGKRLRQAGQKLAQVARRLRSNTTRKNVPAEVREPLAAEADAIKLDAKTLARDPGCTTS